MNPSNAEAQIESFLAKYSPAIAAELRAARGRLQAFFPRGHELVYDSYNALVFGFAATARTSDAFLSVAGYPKWVTLFFLHGATLDDPGHLLQGTGSQVRSIRLRSAEQLAEQPVQALIEQAARPWHEALLRAAPLQTTIKSVSAKHRPRRPSSSPARVGKHAA
jgi:hypothetical protein